MKYLITGAAGFIGTNLSLRLIKEGHEVIGLDNFHSGSQSNIEMLSKLPGFKFVSHDVITPYDIPCDRLCNFACPASPPHYQIDPIYTAKTSFLGTLNALQNAEKYQARLIHASTSEVYGDPLVHPQCENYLGNVNPLGPRACYDEGKRVAETLCADFVRLKKADARIVRIFNTYGPYMRKDDGRVVTNFILQVIDKKPLTVYGTGEQTRSFCYVDDLVEGILRTLNLDSNPGPINLGNPNEFTMLELAEALQKITESRLPIEFKPLPQDDPRQRRPDITKAQKYLSGWTPQIQLVEGLTRAYQYFKNQSP